MPEFIKIIGGKTLASGNVLGTCAINTSHITSIHASSPNVYCISTLSSSSYGVRAESLDKLMEDIENLKDLERVY